MSPATHIDLYQLTSLIPHWDAGLADTPVTMSFFSRRLPQDEAGEPQRGFLLWVGLRRSLEFLAGARFDEPRLALLTQHPMLGQALLRRPKLLDRLRAWRFQGRLDAPPEGTPIWAGPAVTSQGALLDVNGVRPAAQTPYMQIQTDLLTAKLIETPLLSIINHQTMVASKAARVVRAAGRRAVLEFGTRRTHMEAAVDAAYAAYVAGVAGTSNVEAHYRYGVPVLGTMDHFAVQAWEQPHLSRGETERAYFRAFYESFPASSVLLVDTYDAFGDDTGIRNAVRATGGAVSGIRLDSGITQENVWRARRLLNDLKAPNCKILVSGGMDEHAITALGDAPVDGFGIGERIVTSPDAPVGVGAVGKLCEIGGQPTMKLARGSGKATLPGRVQVFRRGGVDTVARHGEILAGDPLLEVWWLGDEAINMPEVEETRAYTRYALAALPDEIWSDRSVCVPVSPALEQLVRDIVARDPQGR
ncbi:hypothetical protein KKF91_05665 [Myxococcota bacterium]|nr:hypothetical protein [Myxococcota bacterium]MBU1430037.1 hypothetical protein [Myxococcota bacterium]MBU1899172.1 hypothetical protein [Myxococcota bacterium]